MNLDELRAGLAKNKKGLALTGAGIVAGLALVKRKSGGASPAAAGDVGPTTGSQYGLTALPARGGVYDSSSSDVYNAIQPQLEQLGRLLEDSQKEQAPIPVAGPPPAASTIFAPSGTKNLIRYTDDGGIYEVQGDGSIFGLTHGQYAEQLNAGGKLTNLAGKTPSNGDGGYFTTATNLAKKAASFGTKPAA